MVKGMKQTEIGLIPEDWEVKKLGSIAFITKLAGFEYSKHFNSYKDGGEIIVVRGTNITNNKLDLTDTKYIPRKVSDFLYRSKLSKGDLVFAYVGTIGPIYLIGENDRFHLGPNTAKIRIEDKDVSTSFIYNYFLSEFIRKEIDDRISVGAQPSLSMTKIRDFSLPLPSLPEQEAIAGALSDADAWIESLEQLIAKKRLIKQGAMQELLTPKEGWEVKKLGEVFKLKQGVQCGVEKQFKIHREGLVRFIRIVDVTQSNTEARFINDPGVEHHINCNDLFMVRYGAPGVVGFNFEGVIANNLFRLIPKTEIDNLYFKHFFDFIKPTLEEISSSSTMAALNFTTLNNIDLSFPSLTEQTCIATILSDLDAELAALEQQLHKGRQIKQGMMQELLTGKIRFEL